MCRLAKGVLNPVLPEDPGVTLTSPPEVVVTKGQKKKNSTKRGKSHWEHVSIAHRKIQKSSGSGFGTGSGSCPSSGSGSGSRGRGRPLRAPRERGRGCDRGRNFVFGDEYHWPEVRRRMLYELEHSRNLNVNLAGSELSSTTVLPLYSYSEIVQELQLNDMCLIPPLNVQWIHHRFEWVSNWQIRISIGL
ncbi:hypothetical protein M9H77_14112 [Catharanthus roseus]|uniref:Uncharacterized protein n=1 Tax=Catharanthus roseus TaxID=4058 RepID=A0ACC0BMA0_CATRO|nr:hypothetical protein M9H77_14112 [Catharanthus roseus]